MTNVPAAQELNESIEQNKDAKTWGMLSHLTALSGFLIPFGNVLGPLIVWLVKKDEMPFVDDQGKESLNFQITATIAIVVCILTSFLVLPLFLAVVIGLGVLIFTIIATIKANEGKRYRYPFTLRLIK